MTNPVSENLIFCSWQI